MSRLVAFNIDKEVKLQWVEALGSVSQVLAAVPSQYPFAVGRNAMTADPLDLQGIDHVEFYVSNARQAAHFYRTALGLRPVAYAGLETGSRERASWVLSRRNVRFVLTSALTPDPTNPVAEFVARHGDGVRDIALRVEDAERAYVEALRRGARGIQEPTLLEDAHGRVTKATRSEEHTS